MRAAHMDAHINGKTFQVIDIFVTVRTVDKFLFICPCSALFARKCCRVEQAIGIT